MGDNGIESRKYTDFTQDEIKQYLEELKQLIRDGQYTISLNRNRTENVDFMEDYNIDTNKAEELLMCFEVMDFCYVVNNLKADFAHEKLYIFCREFELDNRGDLEVVDIYMKSNLMLTRRGDKRVIIISFHKRNKPIRYCFK